MATLTLLVTLFRLLSGWKTYLAAAGLACLAAYQLSQGEFLTAYQTFMAALTAAGLRHAVAKAGLKP